MSVGKLGAQSQTILVVIFLFSPCVRVVVASINFINKQGAVSLS